MARPLTKNSLSSRANSTNLPLNLLFKQTLCNFYFKVLCSFNFVIYDGIITAFNGIFTFYLNISYLPIYFFLKYHKITTWNKLQENSNEEKLKSLFCLTEQVKLPRKP